MSRASFRRPRVTLRLACAATCLTLATASPLCAQDAPQCISHLAQRHVADIMAVRIIDLLEAIQVYDHD